jgi:acetyltransferase-like isoleucine patch superfamily enzyme
MFFIRKLIQFSKALNCRMLGVFWTVLARLRLAANGASVGSGLWITGPINLKVHPKGKLSIGKNCTMHSGFAFNPVGSSLRLSIWVGPGASLEIGNCVGISNATVVAMKQVKICDNVRIGGGSRLYDSDFHSLDLTSRLKRPDTGVQKKPIEIRPGAFIGGHATVLKGSRIGDGSVLGAGAVVAGIVPDGEIWAGNPARRIGYCPRRA